MAKKSLLDKALSSVKKTSKKIVKKLVKDKGANNPQSKKYSVGKDATRKAKPQGYRFTDAGARALGIRTTTKPTQKQIETYKGKKTKSGHRFLYPEYRIDKSDESRSQKFSKGGNVNDPLMNALFFLWKSDHTSYKEGKWFNTGNYKGAVNNSSGMYVTNQSADNTIDLANQQGITEDQLMDWGRNTGKSATDYIKQHKKFKRGGQADFVYLPHCNLLLSGFGVDANGNHVVKVAFPNDRAFAIQTNGVLPETNRLGKGSPKLSELTDAQLESISKEVREYVKEYGSAKQKSKLKIYSKKFKEGGMTNVEQNSKSGYTAEDGDYSINVHGKEPGDYEIICKIVTIDGKKTQVCYHETVDRTKKGVEVYTGSNYIVDSKDKSHSRLFSLEKLPAKYKSVVEELKEEHKKRFSSKKFAAGGSTGDDDPQIYVADLAAYNAGELVGEWLNLNDYSDADELMQAITDLTEKWGEGHEEWSIHDTENIPGDLITEGSGSSEFEEFYKIKAKADEMDLPIEVLLEWKSQTGADIDSASDAYQGVYDDMEDYAYEMIKDGVYVPGANDVYVSDTDKRIVAGEQADFDTEDMSEDDLIERADMQSELQELQDKQDEIEALESEIETLESELEDLEEGSDEWEQKNTELQEKQTELEGFKGFDFDDEKTKLADRAKDQVHDEIYNEWYNGLDSDPIDFLVNDQGIYTEQDALKLSWIQVDYEKVARELGYDTNEVEHDGKTYVFSSNYRKGGQLKGDPSVKVYTPDLFADGGVASNNFKEVLNLGKIDYDGRGRKINKVTIEVNIRNKEKAKDWETLQELHNVPEVAMSVGFWNSRGTDWITGGQMLDKLPRFFPGNNSIKRLVEIWNEYHLNDMKAGTKKQTEAIEAWEAQGNKYNYSSAVEHLKSIGLYDDRGYKYGNGWLYKPVPESVIEEIKRLCEELKAQKFEDGGTVYADSIHADLINDVVPAAVDQFKAGGLTAPARINNAEAKEFSENQFPFRGNNLEGKVLDNGDYVVLSYGYYPIWYWSAKEQKWYGTTDKYSNTTARQISQSRPIHDAVMLPHNELLEKMRSEDARYDLGGIMTHDLIRPINNTDMAHN